MDGIDAAAIRAALLAERKHLAGDLGEAIQAPGQMTYGSQAAAATQVFEQQRDLALRDRASQQLELVEAALARLEAGTFGTCVRCGKPIAPARLEALPWAAHCIDCQAIVDHERR
jgi:DnaK suppressor protein